jgi:death-on-curing protein
VHFSAVVFLAVEDVHLVHEDVIRRYGGAPAVRDAGMIASATMAPQSGYYGTLGEMAAAYVHGLARNHGFVDGNKRTAAGVLMMFLGANGFSVTLAPVWVDIIGEVAVGATTRHQLADMIVTFFLGGRDIEIEP